MTRTSRLGAFLLLATTIVGCGESLPPGQRVTDVDPATATPDYWWDKPSPAKVDLPDFDRAVVAIRGALRARFFEIDRIDLRDGVIITRPLISSQWFEPWRRDTVTTGDVARSSLAAYRRTVRFDIYRTPEGRFRVIPRVLVERQTTVGHRVTTITQYGQFSAVDQSSVFARTDEGKPAEGIYWYATARDYDLETALLNGVVDRAF